MQRPVVAQPDARGRSIGQRQSAAGNVMRIRRPPRMIAPAVIGPFVLLPRRRARGLAQRWDQEHGDAGQTEEVNSGDPQHQLSLARHAIKNIAPASLVEEQPAAGGPSSPRVARYHRLPLMARSESTALTVARREPSGSRAVRRLRREGNVPGIVYGGEGEPIPFQVQARELRLALANAGAVLDLAIDGDPATPVVVKELVRHPVHARTMHIDLLRVNLNTAIQATVVLELIGGDDSPGVKEGGVLELITRELTVEALPTSIPDTLEHDVSAMVIGDTLTLDALSAPSGVTIVGEPDTVIATLSAPRLQVEDETEIEEETEVVGEEAAAEGEAEPSDGDGDSSE